MRRKPPAIPDRRDLAEDETRPEKPGGSICTPDQRVRVFVSSTLAELAPERAAARAAIEEMHLTPVLFELGARPHPPRALYTAYLDQSDVFVGIYWQQYGWVAPGAAVSGLEDEYQLSAKLPRLLYLKEPASGREERLARLVARFQQEGTASYRKFTEPAELGKLIAEDLAILLSERFGSSGTRPPVTVKPSAAPAPLTPTIGRRKEIAAVAGMLRRRVRLLTITGTAGVGKSRLAAVVAGELARTDGRDVYFIPLASLADPVNVMAAIAEHVGARLDTSAPLDALAERLRGRSALLVLDNFEHLAAAAGDVLSLLDRCPDLQVLVTSRHVLRLRGEREFPLAPLDVPSESAPNIRKSDAVRMFVERAAAARPGFALTAGNETSVGELCRRLDGLPLALELAAARVRLLDPAELLDRLGARLDLLAGGASDLPERQRALRTTLDWSYNLLTPAEQTLFARLSVFAGGATLAAAEAVCTGEDVPDVIEVVASLLEKSLLVHVSPAVGPARFQMLHVVRAYAWERLAEKGEADLLRARHAKWFLDMVRSLEATARGDDGWGIFQFREEQLDALDAEMDNIRSVLAWALEQDDLTAVAALARGLRSWWWIRGMVWEALEWLERAAAMADRLAPDSLEKAWVTLALGHLLEHAGRSDDADAPVRTALHLFTEHGEADGAVASRLTLASVLADRGRVGEAIALAEETLEAARKDRRSDVVEWAASIIGTFQIAQGNLDAARAAEEEARAEAARLGADLYVAMAHHQLAIVELLARRPAEYWRHLDLAAAIYGHTPHLEGVSYALEIAAAACLREHDLERAAEAMAIAAQLHDKLRLPVWPVLKPLHDRVTAQLRAATSQAELAPLAPEAGAGAAAVLRRICDHYLRALEAESPARAGPFGSAKSRPASQAGR